MALRKKRKVGEDDTEEHTDKQEPRKDALADMLSDVYQVRRKFLAGLNGVCMANRPTLRIQGVYQCKAVVFEARYCLGAIFQDVKTAPHLFGHFLRDGFLQLFKDRHKFFDVLLVVGGHEVRSLLDHGKHSYRSRSRRLCGLLSVMHTSSTLTWLCMVNKYTLTLYKCGGFVHTQRGAKHERVVLAVSLVLDKQVLRLLR